ncbi:MAG: putative selenate reductase subunit YgfK, partial [Bacteroidetes bacterium 4572_77]
MFSRKAFVNSAQILYPMSDKFYTQSLRNLLLEVLESLDHSDTVFGLPQSEFFIPSKMNSLKITRYGETLATPYGVAAGPHTQLSRNIVASWLMGARYIELKTVQTLDEIEVKKPCIDMQDEGYNCEWSQELKIKNSFNEYLNAWIVIHIINHKMDWGSPIETIFNMSVGYDLQGIMNENVQWFFDNMADCSFILAEKIKEIQNIYPAIDKLYIPNKISNNITLSTMHGCPPNEIEEISAYLIREKKLHTTVKLNPTLLGPEKLRYILNEKLAYPIEVPQEAFHHDIKYADALSIIKNLWALSQENNLHFAIKLTNTLEVK